MNDFKHAILIMAHNNYDYLIKLIKHLDSPKVDVFLHIDKKSKCNVKIFSNVCVYSKIYTIKRKKVHWAAYSQIDCEVRLLKEASKYDYKYYHFISGSDIILRPINVICDYFDSNYGCEFIHFCGDSFNESNRYRLSYYHFFEECNNRNKNKFFYYLDKFSLSVQKAIKIDRVKQRKVFYGSSYYSLTNSFINFFLHQWKKYKKIFKFTRCGDEGLMQTIIINSPFKKNIYPGGNLRMIDWTRGAPYEWKLSDFNELIGSDCFFARKVIDSNLQNKIFDYLDFYD